MNKDCEHEKITGRKDQAGDNFVWWMEEMAPTFRPSQVGEPGAEHRGKVRPATITLIMKIRVRLTTDIRDHASINHGVPTRQP